MQKMDLLNWREFGLKSAPSIQSVFEPEPYEGIDKIVEYLEGGHVALTSTGVGVDELTGKTVMLKREIHDDGEYAWSSMLPYYVRQYNMRLPVDFEKKVLTQ